MGHNHTEDEIARDAGMERELALARFLEIDVDDVSETDYGTFDAGGLGEYRVLTDGEGDEAVAEYIEESLWAFNPDFLSAYIAGGAVDADALQRLIGDSCEGANPALRALVGDRFEEVVEDAIGADGRGHFLAQYDGDECESGDFFLYRVN